MGEARWRGRASVLGLQSVCGFVSWVNLTSDYDVGPGCVVFPSSLDREANARRISVYHYTLHSAQNLIKPYILQASSSPHHHQCLSVNYFIFKRDGIQTTSGIGKSLFSHLPCNSTLQMTDWRIGLSVVFMFVALNWISGNLRHIPRVSDECLGACVQCKLWGDWGTNPTQI